MVNANFYLVQDEIPNEQLVAIALQICEQVWNRFCPEHDEIAKITITECVDERIGFSVCGCCESSVRQIFTKLVEAKADRLQASH